MANEFFRIIRYSLHSIKYYNKRIAKTLDMNKEFENKYAGKRCFILGNGPSLKDEDLSVLKDEYVFTVNQFARKENFEEVKSNFHLWVDPVFFKIDHHNTGDLELLNTMVKISDNNPDVVCFYPYVQIDFVKRFKLDEKLNIRYFMPHEKMSFYMSRKIRWDKYVPKFGTIVQYCISLAIYMGFKEIYLLGCDCTSLLVNFKSALDENDDKDYAYSLSENEKKRMKKMVSDTKLENYISITLELFRDYRLLYEYCNNNGIKLVNCSCKTVLDSIPRIPLKEVLKMKDDQKT